MPEGFVGGGTYTWVMGPNVNRQSPGGASNVVGLPQLILPAGYTVGTVTPAIGPYDQWSRITVQWDAARFSQVTLDTLQAYNYHSKLLLYQPTQVTP